MRVLVGCVAFLVAVVSSVTAQSRIDAGVSAGVVKITGRRSEQAVSGVLEYGPSSWLSLYAIPAVLHVSDSTSKGTFSSSGLGDLPVGVDVGSADSTQALSRVIGVGVRHTLVAPLMVTVDGSRGLTTASPRWVLSVGLGTAFAGASPVTPTTPLRRIRSTFSTGITSKIGCR